MTFSYYTTPSSFGNANQAARIGRYRAAMSRPRFDKVAGAGASSRRMTGAARAGLRTAISPGPARGGTNLAATLAQNFQDAHDASRAANEARYADILGGYEARESGIPAIQRSQARGRLAGFADRYRRGMANLENAGAQNIANIRQDFEERAARDQQALISRGLDNTGRRDSVSAIQGREMARAIGDENERIRQERLTADASLAGDLLGATERADAQQIGLLSGLSSDTLGFKERREDTGPDPAMLAGLLQNFGAAGGGGAGYGVGYGGGSGGGAYLAGAPIYQPLASMGYNVPNLTTMPAANLRGRTPSRRGSGSRSGRSAGGSFANALNALFGGFRGAGGAISRGTRASRMPRTSAGRFGRAASAATGATLAGLASAVRGGLGRGSAGPAYSFPEGQTGGAELPTRVSPYALDTGSLSVPPSPVPFDPGQLKTPYEQHLEKYPIGLRSRIIDALRPL